MTREEAMEELKGCIIAEEHGKDGKPNGNLTCELTRDTLDMAIKALEQEPRWIPMTWQEPTEEEITEYLEQDGEELCYMLTNEMPLNRQEVLVSIDGHISVDVFDEDVYDFEINALEDVDAWMPLPQPYKED